MRCLITGGAGFIGSHIADACLAAGHEVAVLDDLSSGRRENLPADVPLTVCDVGSPEAAACVREVAPDVIFHLAAQIDVRGSVREPANDATINILGTLNLMEAAREAGVKRVIFSSTGGAIYGEQDVYPCGEDHRTDPLSPYGISKLSGEKYLGFYTVQHGIDSVRLRYSNVYGPRQDPHGEAGVVAIFTEKLLAGEACVINGDGGQTRDYVFVKDVVRANMAALEAEPGTYNIGTGVETTVNELYQGLADAAGVETPAEHGPAKPGEQRRSCLSPALAAEKLGWSPQTTLADGLAETVNWFRDR